MVLTQKVRYTANKYSVSVYGFRVSNLNFNYLYISYCVYFGIHKIPYISKSWTLTSLSIIIFYIL